MLLILTIKLLQQDDVIERPSVTPKTVEYNVGYMMEI